MLFAAGLGTRLKPLTDTMPKALVPIAGKPLLTHVIERLQHFGATEIVINVHHFAEQIYQHLANNKYDVDIKVSDETDALLDTGGGLKKALQLFTPNDAPILLHNVDIISNAHLSSFYNSHQNNDVTLMVSQRNSNRQLLFNQQNKLVGWHNLQTGEIKSPYPHLDLAETKSYAFSGIHVISPHIKEWLNKYPDKFSIIDFYLQNCHQLNIQPYIPQKLNLLDVGKLHTLHDAEHFIQECYQ